MNTYRFFLICILIGIQDYIWAQAPTLNLDPSFYWQLEILSKQMDEGSKIELSNFGERQYLRLGSTHENLDIFHPFIAWPEESVLQFHVEDPESSSYQTRMTIDESGDIVVNSLEGNTTRNLVVKSDGTIRPQEANGVAGVYSLTAHDFVSEDNPGDDHNFAYGLGIVYHEGQASMGAQEMLVAPLHLPHGAVIKRVNVYYHDYSNSDTLQFIIRQVPHNDFTGAAVQTLLGKSFDSAPSPAPPNSVSANVNIPVDNLTYAYLLRVRAKSIFSWPGDRTGIRGATIVYEYSGS